MSKFSSQLLCVVVPLLWRFVSTTEKKERREIRNFHPVKTLSYYLAILTFWLKLLSWDNNLKIVTFSVAETSFHILSLHKMKHILLTLLTHCTLTAPFCRYWRGRVASSQSASLETPEPSVPELYKKPLELRILISSSDCLCTRNNVAFWTDYTNCG